MSRICLCLDVFPAGGGWSAPPPRCFFALISCATGWPQKVFLWPALFRFAARLAALPFAHE